MMSKYIIDSLVHYKKLIFFNFFRFKGDNYKLMREYFSEVLLKEIEEFMPISHKKIVDVGGAKGEFCKIISEKRQCYAVNLDPFPGKYVWPNTIVAFADNMPFSDNEFDLVICRGVLEHIPQEKQQASLNEMYRITKDGGLCYVMIPPWYNPHAGHGLKPFHVFPFKVAKGLRQLIFRKRIDENSFEEMLLFRITFRKMVKMIKSSGFKIIATKDTHFRLHFLTKIPLLREIIIPAVSFIIEK